MYSETEQTMLRKGKDVMPGRNESSLTGKLKSTTQQTEE